MHCLKIHTHFCRYVKSFNPRLQVDLVSGELIIVSSINVFVLTGVGTGRLKVEREVEATNRLSGKVDKGKVVSRGLHKARQGQKPIFFWRQYITPTSKYYPHDGGGEYGIN